nr:energy-coupling factor transporter transmembrane component T [Bacillus sp. MUM 116]
MLIDWQQRKTWLHTVNPSLKICLTLLLYLYILFIHNVNILMNLAVLSLLSFYLLTGLSFKYNSILFIPCLFIFLSTGSSMILFGQGDTTWFKWGLIHITEESFYRGIHVGFRAITFAMLGFLFTLTTKPVDLFYSLMQQMKLSPKFAYSFMAVFRLLPILIDEFQTLRFALKVRGIESKKGIKAIIYKTKLYAIPLLAQSIRKAHRIAVAMEAKQFSAVKERTYYYQYSFSTRDGLFFLSIIACLLLAVWAAKIYPYVSISDVRQF